ncbi:MAG: electron transfer flavoprotein subunit alpha/FixB family protein [Acidimicrobiia bacterium]|nr:electron transfer flavoprotein subunit alpha/FixB family protein [Acidimicrobiia bacterium]MYC45155.1 electron transfer flavoprotein subunit alpha/FixB family protein [Acidimicrobiia bacterium]MYI19296.1 electron transfer flavoprotein subunit alpha/FixB family protein [Acidimicrobiia bacterium]
MLLVILEHDQGVMAEAAREALTFGRTLAGRMGVPMHAALIGSEEAALVAEAGAHGAGVVHTVVHPVLSDFGPEAWGEVIAVMVPRLAPAAVLAGGSDRGNEVMAQAAARLDAPFVANCLDVDPAGWSITRIQWGGSLLEDVTLSVDVPLLSCGLHAVAAEAAETPTEPAVEEFEADLDAALSRTVVRDRVVLSAGVTLSTAPVVVGGGRGVGSAEGFAPLEDLADLLGGKVGCSRAVTNNGWRPHSDQVGQTGTRIAPEIYIASGISGAIQHWVGAMGSKHILAINLDPEANIVQKADWAVIGDLHEVIPAISEEIRSRR